MCKLFFFVALAFSLSLFSADYDHHELALFAGEPTAIVGGCVSGITGNYFIKRNDLTVVGHEPISINRYYSSHREMSTMGGWEFFFDHLIAELIVREEGESTLTIPEKAGFRLTYVVKNKTNTTYSYVLKGKYPEITNCFTGEISARLNVLNNKVYDDPKNKSVILVDAADGTQRAYYAYTNRYLFLIWEDLPNKNRVHYKWEMMFGHYRLTKITTTDATTQKHYASVDVQYDQIDEKNLNQITIRTSDHRVLHYNFRNQKHGGTLFALLDTVIQPNLPDEKYEYYGSKKGGCLVVKNQFPEGRELSVHHYIEKNNRVGDENVYLADAKDARYKRIHSLRGPIGRDGSLQNTFTFHYEPGKYRKGAGATTVYDAMGNASYYYYNKFFLLDRIKRCDRGTHPFYEELFHWHPYTKKGGSWLKAKTLVDENGNPFFAHLYHYDTKGNVIHEQFLGNFTGKINLSGIRITDQGPIAEGAESYSIYRKYNKEQLLIQESFANGKIIEYQYLLGTNLVLAKFVFDREQMKIRHFNTYDGSVLVRECIDNGVTYDENDLRGVTHRSIKVITPSTQMESLDLPAAIEERYLDLEANQQVLMSRLELRYNLNNNICSSLHYDDNNTLLYTLQYTYDAKGRLIEKTDPLGRSHQITYDANDNPVFEKDPNQEYVTHFQFDVANRLIQTRKEAPDGGIYTQTNEYNLLSQKEREKDERGNPTEYIYDAFGHPLMTISPPIANEDLSLQFPTRKCVYNPLGKVISKTDPEGNTTHTAYTSRGSPFLITYPDGSQERMYYDLSGNLESQISPLGTKTCYTYDFLDRITSKKVYAPEGEILSEESYQYNAFQLVSKTHPDGTHTHYTYDGALRKIKEETGAHVTLYTYDSLGRVETITHLLEGGKNQVLSQKYDLLGRVMEERKEDTAGTLYSVVKYTYDDNSNQIALIKEVQQGESISRSYYDPLKRVVKEENPLGETTQTIFNDWHQNSLGQTVLQKTTVAARGIKTVETFDTHGNLSIVEKYDRKGDLLIRDEFFYNLNHLKTTQISTLYNPNKKIVKSWRYDSMGRLVELCAPDEKIYRYTYTPEGGLKELIKPDQVAVSYTYDPLGYQTSIKASDGSIDYELIHDKMGNITQAIDLVNNTSTIRTYDHFGNLLHETLGNSFTLHRTYDNINRKTSLTFPDQSKVEYSYDPYHLSAISRLDSTGGRRYTHQYIAYDLSHNLLQEALIKNGGTVSHSVDLCSRRVETQSEYSTEAIKAFDLSGNVTEYLRTLLTKQELSSFAYDDLDQLIEESGLVHHTYAYDSHYNRLHKDGGEYTVNSEHALVSRAEATYLNDANGNRTQIGTDNYDLTYTYDALNRLIQIEDKINAYRFHYDFWNRCLSKTYLTLKNGEWIVQCKEKYLYDELNEIGAYPHQVRILGQGKGAEIGAAIAIECNEAIYIPIHDLFGNIIALQSPDNQTIESYRYTVFGEESITSRGGNQLSTSLIQNPWRYQSKRKVANLVYFGRRFYDPETGRWLSPDPKGFDEGPNLYQYLRNHPLCFYDLYGASIRRGTHPNEIAPLISIDSDFERRCGPPLSFNYTFEPEVDRSSFPANKHVGCSFGILTSLETHREYVRRLSEYGGGIPIQSTYNATHGFFHDVREAHKGLNLIATDSALLIANRWKEALEQSEDDSYLEIAHSQAGINCRNALLLVPEEMRNRITIVSVGGAAYIPSNFCYKAYNYKSTHDTIPKIQNMIGKMKNPQADVIILPKHRNARSPDHGFLSPTYQGPVKNQIVDYLQDEKINY